MKKIIFLLISLFFFLNLISQEIFYDFIENIPCLKNRKIDYTKVNDLLINKIEDLSQIQTDFKLGNDIYILNKKSDKYALYVKYEFYSDSITPENKKIGRFSAGYLLVDKMQKKCFFIYLNTFSPKGIEKMNNNILYTNCISKSTFSIDNLVWYIEELSNQYPYKSKIRMYYGCTMYDYKDNHPNIGDLVDICIFREKGDVLIRAHNIELEYQHNINKISYDDFLRIVTGIEENIRESKYCMNMCDNIMDYEAMTLIEKIVYENKKSYINRNKTEAIYDETDPTLK